uniref:Glycosyl transferase n=1 Tax=Meloidogyne hapla TaxID=6305 RepID=A0A1I8BH56_MELHA
MYVGVYKKRDYIVEIINEDWDLIIIDDLFWTFGFALTTLKQRLWEKNGLNKNKKEPKSIIYSTAGQTLLSAESIKSTGRDWVSKSPLFPFIPTDKNDAYSHKRFIHRLHAFYENGVEYILMNWIGK